MTQYICKYNGVDNVALLTPTSSSVTKTDWSSLIMAPGIYSYNSIKYDLSSEGLYGILNVGVDGGWRIIYQNDVKSLLSALCWMCTYGRMDESLTHAQMATKAKTKKLSMRCGHTVAFVISLLSARGIEARTCRLLTADSPNNWDDGHVAIEVKINGVWEFWDLPNNFYPKKTGSTLNLRDYIVNMDADKIVVADSERDLLGYGSNEVHTSVIYDMFFRTQNNLDAWVDRIYQIPGIVHTDGKTYFYLPEGTESRHSWVEGLATDYVVVSYMTWLAMFY